MPVSCQESGGQQVTNPRPFSPLRLILKVLAVAALMLAAFIYIKRFVENPTTPSLTNLQAAFKTAGEDLAAQAKKAAPKRDQRGEE